MNNSHMTERNAIALAAIVAICVFIEVVNFDWNCKDDIVENIRGNLDARDVATDIRKLAESEDYQYYVATNEIGYIGLYKYPRHGLLMGKGTYVESKALSVAQSRYIYSQAIIEDSHNKLFAVFYPRSMFEERSLISDHINGQNLFTYPEKTLLLYYIFLPNADRYLSAKWDFERSYG